MNACILEFSYNKLCHYERHPFQDFIQISAPQLHPRRRAERSFYDLVLSPLQRSHLGVVGSKKIMGIGSESSKWERIW